MNALFSVFHHRMLAASISAYPNMFCKLPMQLQKFLEKGIWLTGLTPSTTVLCVIVKRTTCVTLLLLSKLNYQFIKHYTRGSQKKQCKRERLITLSNGKHPRKIKSEDIKCEEEHNTVRTNNLCFLSVDSNSLQYDIHQKNIFPALQMLLHLSFLRDTICIKYVCNKSSKSYLDLPAVWNFITSRALLYLNYTSSTNW